MLFSITNDEMFIEITLWDSRSTNRRIQLLERVSCPKQLRIRQLMPKINSKQAVVKSSWLQASTGRWRLTGWNTLHWRFSQLLQQECSSCQWLWSRDRTAVSTHGWRHSKAALHCSCVHSGASVTTLASPSQLCSWQNFSTGLYFRIHRTTANLRLQDHSKAICPGDQANSRPAFLQGKACFGSAEDFLLTSIAYSKR